MNKINKLNPLPWQRRLKSLLFDYLFILAYLLIVLIFNLGYYLLVLKEIPQFDHLTTQLIATFTTVIPIILIFSYLEYGQKSFGKGKTDLILSFQNHTYVNSLIRNIIKFLPWQLGHMSTIRGLYTDFDFFSLVYYALSMGLFIIMILMTFLRSDKRHLADLVAGTQVRLIEEA